MKFPEENSAQEKVCKYLLEVGSATASDVKDAIGLSVNTTARAYHDGFLDRVAEVGGKGSYVYSLKAFVREFLTMGGRYKGAIVPPRTFEFKPWSGKHNLPTGRIDTSRSYITLSSAVPATSIPWRQ